MFAKATYFGFYPLGSDVVLQDVRIMQETWNAYKLPIIVIGKKKEVSPLFGQIYYATTEKQTVFFVAVEYGLGHYHIFSIDSKTQQRLVKRI